jgi:hypothetical protein
MTHRTERDEGEALLDELEALYCPVVVPERNEVKKNTHIPFSGGRRWATASEAALYLGMSTRDIIGAVHRQKLQAVKVRGSTATARMRFSKAELERFRQGIQASSPISFRAV